MGDTSDLNDTFVDALNTAERELPDDEALQSLKVQRSDSLEYGAISIAPSLTVLIASVALTANGNLPSSTGTAVAIFGGLSTLYSATNFVRGYLAHRRIQQLEAPAADKPLDPEVL